MPLRRELGLKEAVFYGVGMIIGAGIYALIGEAAGVAGNAVWMAFGLGALIAAFTGLSYAELGTMFPKSAAEYVYTKEAFGKNWFPFLVGWFIIIGAILAASAVSLGFGGYLYALTGLPIVPSAIGLVIAASFLNFWGIKQSAKANIAFTLIELIGLIIIIILGFKFIGSVDYFEMPNGFPGVMSAALLIFFAYIGFEDVVNVAEETKNPIKVIPKALIISIAVTTLIYILVSISAVSIIPWDQLGQSTAPLADVAEVALPGSSFLLSIIALFATANTVLILLIVESRMIWGMAREGSLPKIFSKLHHTRSTPWVAILLVMFVCFAFVSIGNIKTVAEITNFNVFLVFLSVNAALIWLRFKKPKLKRPFRVPFSIGKLPILPSIGLLFCLYMLSSFRIDTLWIAVPIIGLGLLLYFGMHKLGWIKV